MNTTILSLISVFSRIGLNFAEAEQPTKISRIGYGVNHDPQVALLSVKAFRHGLRDLAQRIRFYEYGAAAQALRYRPKQWRCDIQTRISTEH